MTIVFLKIRSQPRLFCVCACNSLGLFHKKREKKTTSTFNIFYSITKYVFSFSLSLSLTRLREQSLLKLSRSSVFVLVPTCDALFFTVVCEWFRTWRRPRRARRTGSVSPPARSSRLISSISPTRRHRYSSRSRFDRHKLTHH